MTKTEAKRLLIKAAKSRKYKVNRYMFYKLMCKLYNQVHKTHEISSSTSASNHVLNYFFENYFIDDNTIQINEWGLGTYTEDHGLDASIRLLESCT